MGTGIIMLWQIIIKLLLLLPLERPIWLLMGRMRRGRAVPEVQDA